MSEQPKMKFGVYRLDIGCYTGLFPAESMAKEWAAMSYGKQFAVVDDLEKGLREQSLPGRYMRAEGRGVESPLKRKRGRPPKEKGPAPVKEPALKLSKGTHD